MKYDERILWDCNADMDSDYTYRSDDVYVVNALIQFILTNQTGGFTDFYNTLVTTGQAVPMDLTNFNTNSFFQKNYCFDFNLDGEVDESDILIYDAFQSWLVSRGNLNLDVSELNEFKTYYNSLVRQGIIQSEYLQLDTTDNTELQDFMKSEGSPLMLPTQWIDNEQYIISTDGKILKLEPGEKLYDESNSQLGSNVDADAMNFMVADPAVKTFYDWDGVDQPRTWKQTGICKVLNIENNELKSVYGIAEPPVDILVNRNLPNSFIPFGTKSLFHGKTISIFEDKKAVSGAYADSGVVFIYQYQSETSEYKLIHEVIVPGNFSSYLPVVELHRDELFVSNPSISVNPEIYVFDIKTPNILTITHHTKLPCPIPVKEPGFGSSMSINFDGDYLVVGNPTQYTTRQGNVDQYTTGDVDYPTGAIFIYKKAQDTWSHNHTIFPNDIDDYIQKDFNNGLDSDIQFGYSVKYTDGSGGIWVGCPRAYSSSSERREGKVYNIRLLTDNVEFTDPILMDEENTNTLNITSGEFNFGLDIAMSRDIFLEGTAKVWVLQNIPNQGTFVAEYIHFTEDGVWKMQNNQSMYKVSDSILNGHLELGSDKTSLVYGSTGTLYLLDTT